MNYFEDLNPYLVNEDKENEGELRIIPNVPPNSNPGAIPQIYLGNIIRLNVGKVGSFYFTFSDSEKWRDEVFVGTVEDAGQDYFIIKDINSEDRYILSFVYLLWSKFNEPINNSINR